MTDTLSQFNAYTYRTLGHRVLVSPGGSVFTPDTDKVYLLRSVRAVNLTAGAVTIDMSFYSGTDSTEYLLTNQKSIAANDEVDILPNHQVVVRGDLGDEIRAFSAVADEIDLTMTFMIVGRETGL